MPTKEMTNIRDEFGIDKAIAQSADHHDPLGVVAKVIFRHLVRPAFVQGKDYGVFRLE